jgi:DNA-binding transcriptional LysR family regulator
MNVHHLELFYYVAKHGGVSAAARLMPYGIQQPAISAQILQLEDSLGATLFHRRPFKLTPQGETLFEFIEPFFGGLVPMGQRLRGGAENQLRIAAPEIVQNDYLPLLLKQIRAKMPKFHFTLTTARINTIENQLLSQEVDVGFASIMGKCQEGIQHRELMRLPMTLLVPAASSITTADEVFSQDRIHDALITLPSAEPVCRLFQEELQKRKLDWFPTQELSSLDLVSRYVTEGFGIGLSLAAPLRRWPKGVRALPLPGFPDIVFGALWAGRLSPMGTLVIEEAEALVQAMARAKAQSA